MEEWRVLLALGLALGTAAIVDVRTRARGLEPPWGDSPMRKAGAFALLGLVLFLIFFGLATVDLLADAPVPESVDPSGLFALQLLLVLALVGWFVLGWRGRPAGAAVRQLGLRARRPLTEVGLGLGLGVLAWAAALLTTAVVAALWGAVGGGLPALDDAAAQRIGAIAALPVGLRLAVAVTAGVVEEVFFRGFLQGRLGIAGASVLFVVAHVGYGQPFLLVGVAVLSGIYGAMVRWRGNVWAAVVAHFLFDAIQLLVVIPAVLGAAGGEGG